MGTWGPQPKDNDTSWDLWSEGLMQATEYCTNEFYDWGHAVSWPAPELTSSDRFARAGLIHLLLESGALAHVKVVRVVVGDLRKLAEDSDWLLAWKRSPKKELLAVASAMESLLPQAFRNKVLRCKVVLAPRG